MGFGFDESQYVDHSQTFDKNDDRSLAAVETTQDTPTLRRLKRRASPDGADEELQPYLSPRVNDGNNNAFHRMMSAAKQQPRERFAGRSNLVDEQAEESDEDNGWAPVGAPEAEEDEDEEDGYVPDLVDDAGVDEEEKRRQDELAAEKARWVEQKLSFDAVLTWMKEKLLRQTMLVAKLRLARSPRGNIAPSVAGLTFTLTRRMMETDLGD